jgi:Flp pilus assembly protein TadB
VIAASIYLYQRRKRATGPPAGGRITRSARDFVFVWMLLALLILYVVSIGQGSYLLFAIGNIVVETLLIIYVMRIGRASRTVNDLGSKT